MENSVKNEKQAGYAFITMNKENLPVNIRIEPDNGNNHREFLRREVETYQKREELPQYIMFGYRFKDMNELPKHDCP